ncbi:aldo/keto reductase [Lutibaculum baratangense]|uniref:Oxidoreductase of aldo/keto reductase family, subgroup 1 n=1 Tax=Lutibaculum baratangense AMV1 TaxID=631454 RepID=V4RKI4_9HYPH|nr:aldo/keto reductase [Lutibaculum baratangense]ESR26561.1 oxidoreductase of aldo/keto reductase family, subgroup 1 [Lutibaculum baratangense AMV1]
MQTIHANGADIPAIGLGTWQLTGEQCADIVRQAIELGYRHIDTAAAYGNEVEVGEGVRRSGISRDEVFVTTKVWHDNLAPDLLVESVEGSLERLDLGHIDLLLIHWPSRTVPLEETLAAMSQVRETGCAKHIGVSNFPSGLLRRAVGLTDTPLVANQIEYHPYIDQTKPLAAARESDVATIAYTPIGRGKVFEDPVIREIAERHGKTPSQVTLRWLVQQDRVGAIPRTSKIERLHENIDIFDFDLSREEMDRIHSLARPDGRMVDPEWAPDWD